MRIKLNFKLLGPKLGKDVKACAAALAIGFFAYDASVRATERQYHQFYLDKARMAPFYNGLKRDVSWILNKVPVVGESVEHVLGGLFPFLDEWGLLCQDTAAVFTINTTVPIEPRQGRRTHETDRRRRDTLSHGPYGEGTYACTCTHGVVQAEVWRRTRAE